MLVDNDVTHDSRVLKTAATAAAAGCEVLVVGLSRSSERWEERRGPVRIVRVPLLAGGTALARMVARAGHRSRAASDASRARRPGSRLETARRRAGDGTLLPVLRGRAAERLPHRLYPGWTHVFPQFVQFRRAAAPLLDAFAADLVHAHDLPALEAGAHARSRGRAAGRATTLVYDAHEYSRGLDTFSVLRHRACIDAEAEHVGEADRIITVSPVTAGLLESDYGLGYRPEVVYNAPLTGDGGSARAGLRAALGLPAGVPLLVYTGVVKPTRGLEAAVEALPALPGAHLALVTDDRGPSLQRLRARAEELGVAQRLHVTPYVPAHQVSAFVADASLGISALVHYGNAEATLPNKLFDYLHAGLPVVVSDVRASRELTESLGFGEPFRAGDAADFARAARLVLEQPERYRAAAGALERYSWEAQGERLLDVYASLLGPATPLERPSAGAVAAIVAGASER